MIIGIVFLLLGIGPAASQRLREGEQTLFLKSGDKIYGKIIDLNSAQLVLELEVGTKIPLRDLWMINFVTEEWNFPQERNLLETNEQYVFQKNGNVSSGRITAFSKDQRIFEFESGEKFPMDQCRRIYFSKTVPRNLR